MSAQPPTPRTPPLVAVEQSTENIGLLDVLATLALHRRKLFALPLIVGALAFGITSVIPPTFTAKTIFVPPQQSQGSAASALASLGALASLAGGGSGGMKTTADQYVTLMQSANVEDRLIDRFKLMEAYDVKHRVAARLELERNTRITLGKKDGLITVEVDAENPAMAADMANQYVSELRRLTSELALTEAQQRRAFFENEVKRARGGLDQAQASLQAGGFNAGALKAEPKAAAENYARIKAQLTTAEVRLQTMRSTLADNASELQQQMTLVGALRGQLTQLEARNENKNDADYLGRYREFKYQETLFELFSRQYEMARLDESRDGAVVQIVDHATPPERKSKPKRVTATIGAALLTFLLLSLGLVARQLWRAARLDPTCAPKFELLDRAWRGDRA